MITSQVAGILTLHLPGRNFYSLSQLLEGVKGGSGDLMIMEVLN